MFYVIEQKPYYFKRLEVVKGKEVDRPVYTSFIDKAMHFETSVDATAYKLKHNFNGNVTKWTV